MSGGDFVEGVMQDIAKELGKPYSALQSFTQK